MLCCDCQIIHPDERLIHGPFSEVVKRERLFFNPSCSSAMVVFYQYCTCEQQPAEPGKIGIYKVGDQLRLGRVFAVFQW